MKKTITLLLVLLITQAQAQDKNAFKKGEFLSYRVHYGLLNAGYATLFIDEVEEDSHKLYHITGKGWTSGIAGFFFKVNDNYQSFISKETMLPYKFRRRVNEGGYIINRDIYFDHDTNTALIQDNKNNTEKKVVARDVQDMLSAVYFLRNTYTDSLKVGESLKLKMFFDSKTFPFRLKLLGRQSIKTKFGKIKCLKFRPVVESGRVFKEKESLTVWVTDDLNKIPVRVKAKLVVGSIKADLYQFQGLSFPTKLKK